MIRIWISVKFYLNFNNFEANRDEDFVFCQLCKSIWYRKMNMRISRFVKLQIIQKKINLNNNCLDQILF